MAAINKAWWGRLTIVWGLLAIGWAIFAAMVLYREPWLLAPTLFAFGLGIVYCVRLLIKDMKQDARSRHPDVQRR